MRILLGIFIVLLTAYDASGQLIEQDSIPFKGIVFDQNRKGLPNTHIIINGQKGTLTSGGGFFNIRVNAGDTLKFSYVGYKDFKFVVPDTMQRLGYITGIFLKRDTLALPEVVVMPWLNKQQFRQAFIDRNKLTRQEANAKANLGRLTTKPEYKYSYMRTSGADLQLKKFTHSQQYKGLVSPDHMVGFDVAEVINLILRTATWNQTKEKEVEKLRNKILEYYYYQQRKEEGDQPSQ